MSVGSLRDAGDAALLLELEPAIDARVNARAIGIASAIRRRGIPGVRDVCSTYCSVAVHFDPLATDVPALRAAIDSARTALVVEHAGALVEVPVVYGGTYGPDLDAVAARARLTPAEAIARHTAIDYRVFMLGFLPGFAYMGTVDPAIATPRHPTPRVAVPAGSVGIAGSQTGVYPFESPGGWQIIGRTPLDMFDATRQPPALCAPGDRVRFVPTSEAAIGDVRRDGAGVSSGHAAGVPGVTVLRPGLFTTIQDEGRWGHQRLGVPVSGAMDIAAHRAANALVGNDAGAATLEATLLGPELRVEQATVMAITGANLSVTLDGAGVPIGRPMLCREGNVVRFGGRRTGGRAYVAFRGGLAVPPVLGSRATHVRSRMGGLDGRALRAGDRLSFGAPNDRPAPAPGHARPPAADGASGARLRVLPGPQDALFPPDALDALQAMRFTVAPQSDRMGYRLTGPRPVPTWTDREMISDATFTGAIQVPPSGQPILLMADRQTMGGYPQIAVVISADLPLAGQLLPGDWVELVVCSHAEARAALGSSVDGRRAHG